MASHYTDNGVLFLRSTNIEPFNIKMDDVKYISPEFNETIKKSQLNPDDVVIVRTGKPGACTVIPQKTEPWNCSDLVIIHPNKEKINPHFLASYINLASGVINAHLVGAVQQHFNVGAAKKMKIPLPSIDVQNRIASIIQGLNDKIEINNKINENLEQQASIFVERYIKSTFNTVILSDIMSFDNGFAFQSNTYLPAGQYRIITIKNVQDGFIDSSGTAFIDTLPSKMKSCCVLHIGDVLLSLTGNVGRVGIVCENDLLLNQRVAKFVPVERSLLPFLYFLFRQPHITANLKSIAKGTAQLNLSPVETLKQRVPYEKKTAEVCSQMLLPLYRAIISNNQQSIVLTKLRDSLLPKLISGEIDVTRI